MKSFHESAEMEVEGAAVKQLAPRAMLEKLNRFTARMRASSDKDLAKIVALFPALARPSWRTVRAGVVFVAVTLITAYALAWFALRDIVSSGPTKVVHSSDMVTVAGKPVTVNYTKSALRSGQGVHAVIPSRAMPVEARLTENGAALLSVDAEGVVVNTRLSARSNSHNWASGIRAHWRRAIWMSYLFPTGSKLLTAAAPYVPFAIPESARPRRLGSFSDCNDCPEMMLMSDGWGFKPGKGLVHWPLSATAYSAKPVSIREWQACVDAKQCDQRGQRALVEVSLVDMQRYVDWLGTRTKRRYAFATTCQTEDFAAFLDGCTEFHPVSTASNLPEPLTEASGRTIFRIFTTLPVGRKQPASSGNLVSKATRDQGPATAL